MSSVTSRMTDAAVGQPLHVDGRGAGRAHLGELQVAEREAGELVRLVAEHLGGGLAPVVALQQGRQVVGRAAGRAGGASPPSPERAAAAARSSS